MSNGPINVYPNAHEDTGYEEERIKIKTAQDQEAILNQQYGGDSLIGEDIEEDNSMMSLFNLISELDSTNKGLSFGNNSFQQGSISSSAVSDGFKMGQQIKANNLAKTTVPG